MTNQIRALLTVNQSHFSIYETLHQCEPEDVSVSLCVDIALNWLLNLFDIQRQGFIRVLSFKLAIAVLSRAPLAEKYSALFTIAGAGQDRLDHKQLGLLLYDLVMIPKYLGEVAQFGGTNIEPSVRSCLSVGSVDPRAFVNRHLFLRWLEEEPQCLVWLPLLHRLATAETATHDAKCRICKVYPIVGFRYHCRKCFNLDICHTCFFTGATYRGHKPEHPMQVRTSQKQCFTLLTNDVSYYRNTAHPPPRLTMPDTFYRL